MNFPTVRALGLFLLVFILVLSGCTGRASERTGNAPASQTSEAAASDTAESALTAPDSGAYSDLLREVLQGNQQDLERIAEDLIAMESSVQQPFSMDYQLYSGDLYVTLANSNTECEETDNDAILTTVRQIHSNPLLESTFEHVCISANREGFPTYVCEFLLPVIIDESGSHHRFSLCYCQDEAPAYMSYYAVEKLSAHWFILEEIME